jgi:hypothetical protein
MLTIYIKMLTKITQNIPKYFCEYCNIKTNNKKDYEKHIMTAKHSKLTNVNKMLTENPQKDSICDFMCQNCNKEYKSRVGLWKHKKICNIDIISETDKDENIDKDQLILMLVKQNSELIKETSEFKNMMMEVIKNGTHNTTHTNSHNKTFNLQFFLNETCKDAMNIMDFVDSVKLQLSDLENVGKIGYVEGISSIIVKNLNSLDETKRPVHCTDAKREVMYVKDEDKWEKENENKQKMRKVIKHIAHKNSKLLNDFKNKHPDCVKSESRHSDKYDKLVIEAMGGKGDNDLEKEDKIIKNIAKQVTIDSKA